MSESVGEFEYNKKDLIGHGAFAVVFKGRKKQSPEFVVAVKVITKKNLSKSQNLLAKEIKILKELKHENVVCLFDCQENQTQVNLVMEYCNGGDLADYLQLKGTLSEDTICFFLAQMASAMKALNSKGIVHRDLKPQNILLSYTPKTNNPPPSKIKIKIADFGFARFLHGDMMAATLCGSPMYMAPEVIMSRQYDAKADLWSLGTIIFQCLTGKAPFQASSPQGLKKFYERNKVIYPNIPAGTSQYLEDLLMRLLRRSPKDRIDFDDFFKHPFLTGKAPSLPSTPVAVPGRQRAYSTSSRGIRSPSTSPGVLSSPNYGAEVLGDVRVDILTRMTPPYDTSPRSVPSTQGGWSGTVQKSLDERPVHDDELDFVMVPDDVGFGSGEGDGLGGRVQAIMSDPVFPICSSPPRHVYNTSHNRLSPVQSSPRPKKGSIFTVGSPSSSPSSPPAVKLSPVSPTTVKTQGSPQFKSSQVTSPTSDHRTPRSGTLHHASTSPGQLSAAAQKSRLSSMVQKSPKQDVISSPVIPVNSFKNASPVNPTPSRRRTVSESTSPMQPVKEQASVPRSAPSNTSVVQQAAPVTTQRDKPVVRFKRAFSECMTTETGKLDRDVLEVPSNFSPILAAFAQQSEACNRGVSPLPFSTLAATQLVTPGRQMTRVQSSPAILAMGMQLTKAPKILSNAFPALPSPVFQPLPKAITSLGLQFGLGNSPPAKQSSSPSSLPTIPGSPVKKCKDFDRSLSEPNCQQLLTVSSSNSPPRCTVSLGKKITKGFTEEQPMVTCGGCGTSLSYKGSELIYGTSPPNMEGPICFVPPELPEDTLLETEHTDGLVKLNFSLSLCKAILETAAANTAILSRALTDSLYTKQGDVSSPDQLGYLSEENRRMEESVLYFKTLKILNEALKFAREEIAAGRMKPSTAVKKVVKELNEKNHQVLNKAKDLRHQMTSGMTLGGIKLLTISADKLMYNYALQLCQSAALDELFGNPRECRERYETAQVLLQGLQDDVHKEADQVLLTKYKGAINTRLTLLNRRPSAPSPCIVSEIK